MRMIATPHWNSIKAMSDYFGQGIGEFYIFWASLSCAEQDHYRSIDLETGKVCVAIDCMYRH